MLFEILISIILISKILIEPLALINSAVAYEEKEPRVDESNGSTYQERDYHRLRALAGEKESPDKSEYCNDRVQNSKHVKPRANSGIRKPGFRPRGFTGHYTIR